MGYFAKTSPQVEEKVVIEIRVKKVKKVITAKAGGKNSNFRQKERKTPEHYCLQ